MLLLAEILKLLCLMAVLHFYNIEWLQRERSFRNLYRDADSTLHHIERKKKVNKPNQKKMKQGLLTDVEITFRYARGEYNAKEKALPIAEAFELCKSIAEKFPEVESLQEWWSGNNTLERFGYMGSSKGGPDGYSYHVNTYLPREKGNI